MTDLTYLGKFDVDGKSFFIKFILLRSSNLGNLRSIEIIQSVDVVLHTILLGLDGSQNKEILKGTSIGETRAMKNNTF